MTTVTLDDLVVPQTRESVLGTLLGLLVAADFPVTSWQATSEPRALVEMEADALSDLSSVIAEIAKGGFLDYAEGPWLKLLAKSVFDVDFHPAVTLLGTERLSNSTGGGIAVLAGQWFESDSGLRYVSTTGGTVPAGSLLDVTIQAESPGALYNVAVGSISAMLTPVPGITAGNPAVGITGTWIVTQGVDEESDALLRARCRARWGALGAGGSADAYRYWVTTASAQVTRMSILENVPVDGWVSVYVAGPAGGLDPSEVAVIDAYVQPRRPLCVKVAITATSNFLYAVTGDVKVRAAYLTSAQAAAASALKAHFEAIPVGGTIEVADLVRVLDSIPGVVNVGLIAPATGLPARLVADDVALTPFQCATYTTHLTWTAT